MCEEGQHRAQRRLSPVEIHQRNYHSNISTMLRKSENLFNAQAGPGWSAWFGSDPGTRLCPVRLSGTSC